MKKTKASPSLFLCLFLALVLTLSLSLGSCDFGSLVPGTTEGEKTVFQPIDGTTAPQTTQNPVGDTSALTTAPPAATTTPPVTTAPPPGYHPLTGLEVSYAATVTRPLAFCVTGASASAIRSADVVVEALTEGASTRLSLIGTDHRGLFNSLTVTSTRPHLAALTHDFYGISVYRGTTDNGHPSVDFLYDTLDLTGLTAVNLDTLLAEKKYETAIPGGSLVLPYAFAPLGSLIHPGKTPCTYAFVPFGGGSGTSFTYDAVKQAYTLRSGAALLPSNDSLPTFTNVLVLFHDATERVTKDGKELTLDTASQGTGFYMTAGGVMPILWHRTGTSALRITDEGGTQLTVNRGKTYIAMTTYAYRDLLLLN